MNQNSQYLENNVIPLLISLTGRIPRKVLKLADYGLKGYGSRGYPVDTIDRLTLI